MKTLWTRAALAAALALACAGLSGCGSDAQSREAAKAEEAEKADRVPVEVGSVVTGNLAPTYAATANLEAERDAKLVVEIAGEVVEILVEEGDHVAAGQVLARIDARWQSLELRQQQSLADRLAHDVSRNDRLLDKSMISREAYDQARYARDTQDAAVGLARLAVDKTAIRAPYAGVVTRRHIKQGQWLKLQDPAFEIADFSELKARIDVPERVAHLLAAGQPVVLGADALPGHELSGTVERVSPVVDRATGTVGAVVAVDNPDGVLRPGLFVRLAVNYEQIADATLMPKSAVVGNGSATHVWVVEDTKVAQREVRLGVENGSQVQVIEGLAVGATVVTVGQSGLKDGDKVVVVTAAEVDPASATAAL
ncbi:MAG TPA: efflux RND transporter periplasmic adaptor subunit [Pseudomonadota bacterium]|nr:efflux RND transporter periplasmic adaptor subunit [Pseudomonadota bacterium]